MPVPGISYLRLVIPEKQYQFAMSVVMYVFIVQAVNDFTAFATSVVAIFPSSWPLSSLLCCSAAISYSFLDISRLMSAYCSLVSAAAFQCGASADLTILLIPSLASMDIAARTGDVSSERGSLTVLCLGLGCRISVVGEEH